MTTWERAQPPIKGSWHADDRRFGATTAARTTAGAPDRRKVHQGPCGGGGALLGMIFAAHTPVLGPRDPSTGRVTRQGVREQTPGAPTPSRASWISSRTSRVHPARPARDHRRSSGTRQGRSRPQRRASRSGTAVRATTGFGSSAHPARSPRRGRGERVERTGGPGFMRDRLAAQVGNGPPTRSERASRLMITGWAQGRPDVATHAPSRRSLSALPRQEWWDSASPGGLQPRPLITRRPPSASQDLPGGGWISARPVIATRVEPGHAQDHEVQL